MARIFLLFVLLSAFGGLAPVMVPAAKQAVRLVAARDDPPAIADLGLAGLTPREVETRIGAALDAGDADLAASFLDLADGQGLAVPAELRGRVDAATSGSAAALAAAGRFGRGFLTGEPEDLAGLAGAAMGDLTTWGDIRDASREGYRLATGGEADELILGLSVAGLAVTAGSYATLGAGLPVRAGISLVKVARRTGHLSAAMGRALARAVRESVDFAALRRAGTGLDAAALKGVVRADGLKSLARMMGDLGTVQAKAGTRAALEGLRVAEGGGDLRRLAVLAEAKGGQTLAILKMLGRGALRLTGALVHLAWWGFAAAAYVFGLVSAFNSFCVAAVRPLWRRKDGRRRHRPPSASARPVAAPIGATAPDDGACAEHRFLAAVREVAALDGGASGR